MLAYNLTTPPPVAAMFLRAPVRMPSPRQLVEAETARLIDVLDALDLAEADPDLEGEQHVETYDANGNLCRVALNSDDEPSIGSIAVAAWGCGGDPIDLEADDCDLEPGGDDEPSLGSVGSTFGGSPRHAVTTRGHTYNAADQRRWASGARDDREEDVGDEREVENEHGGDVQDEPHDEDTDLEPDVDGEPSLSGITVSEHVAMANGGSFDGDDEEGGDLEGNTDDNGLGDMAGGAEQMLRYQFAGGDPMQVPVHLRIDDGRFA